MTMNNDPPNGNINKKFEDEGYAIVRQVYSQKEIQRIKNAVEQFWLYKMHHLDIDIHSKKPLISLFPPLRNAHMEDEYIRELSLQLNAFHLVEELFKEEALIVGTTIFYKPPGAPELPMHQDNYDIGAFPGTTCAVWISLDVSDAENGGLRVVPKTHKLGLLKPRIPGHRSAYGLSVKVPANYEVITLSTEPGDIVTFNGDLLHGSGKNFSSNRFRRSFVIHFVPASTTSIFVQHKSLINKKGETVVRTFNKRHSVKQLFLGEKK